MKCTAICTAWLAAVLAVWAWGAETLARGPADQPAPPADPLDQELLKDLERRSGQTEAQRSDLPAEPRQSGQLGEPGLSEQSSERTKPEKVPIGPRQPAPGGQPPAPPPAQNGDGIDDLQERLRRELGEAAVSEEHEPLLEIARQMRVVEKRIEQLDSGRTTQGLQAQIVSDLDRLISEARRACKQGGPGAGQPQPVAGRTPVGPPNGQQPAGQQPGQSPGTTSAPRQGETEPGAAGPDALQLRELVKNLWGELPPHAREQMLESFDEAFVPKYRLLIEQYFRRLAEGRQQNSFGF